LTKAVNFTSIFQNFRTVLDILRSSHHDESMMVETTANLSTHLTSEP